MMSFQLKFYKIKTTVIEHELSLQIMSLLLFFNWQTFDCCFNSNTFYYFKYLKLLKKIFRNGESSMREKLKYKVY